MEKAIIIFDGECNLCNGVVGWLLRYLPANEFAFIPFQSSDGNELVNQHGFPTTQLDTVILIQDEKAFTHSDGFLKMVSYIPKYKLVAALLAFVPRFLRDTIYKIVAKYRIKWFGKSASCTIPIKAE